MCITSLQLLIFIVQDFMAELCSILLMHPPDYHFSTREVMQEGIDNGDFIENAVFSGNMYGTRYMLFASLHESHYMFHRNIKRNLRKMFCEEAFILKTNRLLLSISIHCAVLGSFSPAKKGHHLLFNIIKNTVSVSGTLNLMK